MKYSGIVQKGEGRGSEFGFPTANIPVRDDSLSGIYAACVEVEGNMYNAAVYADTRRELLEAYLLDFAGDLYGKGIEIELLEKIRADKAFKDAAEAREYIAKDIEAVRAYFHRV